MQWFGLRYFEIDLEFIDYYIGAFLVFVEIDGVVVGFLYLFLLFFDLSLQEPVIHADKPGRHEIAYSSQVAEENKVAVDHFAHTQIQVSTWNLNTRRESSPC